MAKPSSSFGIGVKEGQKARELVLTLLVSSLIFSSSCATSAHSYSRSVTSGNQAALQGDYQDAAKHYEEALRELPESFAARRNLGIVLVKLGDYPRALKALKAAYPRYKTDVEFQYYLGECYRGLKKFSKAAEHYQLGLRQTPSDMRLVKALAWTWHKMNHNSWTTNLLTPYLSSAKQDHQIRLILASALNASNKHKDAAKLLQFAEQKNFRLKSKDRVSAQAEKMLLLSTLAESYLGLNNCKRAKPLFMRVIKNRPFFDRALVGTALCMMKANKTRNATRMLERAVKANPDSWQAHFHLARLFESKNPSKSVFYYSRFLKITQQGEGEVAIATRERKHARQALSRLRTSR